LNLCAWKPIIDFKKAILNRNCIHVIHLVLLAQENSNAKPPGGATEGGAVLDMGCDLLKVPLEMQENLTMKDTGSRD